jgi:3-oxoacyl-[acyl-carrier protein] reductase
MSDRYLGFANSNLGRRLVDALGLPHPAPLERWQAGRLRPVEGALVLGGGPLTRQVEAIAPRLTDELYSFNAEGLQAPAWVAGLGPKLKAVVFDATHLSDSDELKQLREFFQPLLRSLAPCAHVVILGRAPEGLDNPLASVTQRALEGFNRSLGKELRNGATAQLLYIGQGAEDQLEGALRFFLSPKSAFISGQVLRLEACASQVEDWTRPLGGRRALVTGAARGIGAAIAETAPRCCCWMCHKPGKTSKPSLRGWAAKHWRWTSAPMTPQRSCSKRCPGVSTSWCTTPASPATKPWPT